MKIKDKTKETYVFGGFGLTSVPEYSQEDGTNQRNSTGKGQRKKAIRKNRTLECNRQRKEKRHKFQNQQMMNQKYYLLCHWKRTIDL